MQVAAQIHQAADIIRKGGIVAFPTETSYGLAVDPFNEHALEKLYCLKERPVGKPFLLLVSNRNQLEKCVSHIPTSYTSLMADYWPGPLTLIFPASQQLPQLLSKDGGVAIRHTSGSIALALIDECGIPLTATSANRSGNAPALTGAVCKQMFKDSDVYVIDDNARCPGLYSTMVSEVKGRLALIRDGVVDVAAIIENINKGNS